MTIKLLTFDLDNTLWATTPVIIKAEQALHQWLLNNCPEVCERFNPKQLLDARKEYAKLNPELSHRLSTLRLNFLEYLINHCGYDNPKSLAQQGFDVFYQARQQVILFDGVLETLQLLSKSYRLGALTNGNANISLIKLDDYFDFAFSAEDHVAPKPHPALFHAALDHTSCKADEVIHIGDHHEHDIFGAQQLGIKTIWVNLDREEWPGEEPATAEINHLSELPQAVAVIDR